MTKAHRFAIEMLLVICMTIPLSFNSVATAQTSSTPSECPPTSKPKLKQKLKPPPPCAPCIPLNCCCPTDICNCLGKQGDGGSGNAKPSPEVEQIAKLADLTLKGVASHTEFLTKLWTLTTFVGGAIAVVLAIFGIRSIRDVQRLKEQAHTDIAEIKKNFEQMSKDTTANHVVMMACYSAKLLVDSAIAIELRYKSGKDDIKAADKSEMEREANDLFKSAKDQLREVLQLNEPKDPAVGAWVYNLYAYALSEIGEFSQALTAAKKSLGFRPANASALYNAACYAALLHLAKESIDYLKQAVEHDHTFLNAAKTDPDFTAIRNSKEFKEFVGE